MADVWNHQHAEVNGIKLHYVRQGEGTPLFLIHGWPGFWFEWNQNIGPLSETFGKRPDVLVPLEPEARPAVDQKERRATALANVVQLDAVYLGVLVVPGARRA